MDSDSFISEIQSLFNGVTVMTPSFGAIVALLLAVILLGCSAFVSASEIAFFSLSPNDLNEVDKQESMVDKRIKSLLNDSEHLLATILIANDFVNVTIIMLLNYFFANIISWGNSLILQFVVVTVILTFLLLLFGEIMPKIYSAQYPLKFARNAARTLCILKKLFFPLSNLLVRSSFFMKKVVDKKKYNISVDDLSQALELTDKKEIFDESNILEGIIRFGGETAKEIMTPRMDMIGLEINTTYPDVLKCIVDNVYSRIPIYSKSPDNIKGILYIKDLLPHLKKPDNFRWQSLVRPAYFVPETKMIDDLLREFQQNRVHMAIVVDEFGGTSGIVTMEDIIEEIVGEINDEFDEDERNYVKLNDNTYIFEGKVLLSDFYKVLDSDTNIFEDIEGDADTLAGLLLEIKGDFPRLHEKMDYKNFHFEVLAMDTRRIKQVKVIVDSITDSADNDDKEKKSNTEKKED